MQNGEQCAALPSPLESANYARQRLAKLNPEHKRFDNPHIYKVGISKKLMDLRDKLTQILKKS
jgi:nicotinate phosphoribosyltransferase